MIPVSTDAPTALVVGGSGMVGAALTSALASSSGGGWRVRPTSRVARGDRVRLDLFDPASIVDAVRQTSPSTIVLAVDGAARAAELERDPSHADALFVAGTRAVVDAARGLGARVVLLSTDLVFAGTDGPYGEHDAPRPCTVVGTRKAAAEEIVLSLGSEGLVARTSEVFGWDPASPNLAMEVWRRAGTGRPVVASRTWQVTPTAVQDVASGVAAAVRAELSGVVHIAGAESRSRFDLAADLATALGIDPSMVVDGAEWLQDGGREVRLGLSTGELQATTSWRPTAQREAVRLLRGASRQAVRASTADASAEAAALRDEILERVERHHALAHAARPFEPLRSRVPYAGRVFGADEVVSAVDASLDFWLTLGPRGAEFEQALCDRIGAPDAVFVNSGSSANLTAMLTLTSERCPDRLRLHPGDEVVTPAVTFPTTLAPVVQCGLVPVLVDCEIGTYNADPAALEAALSPKTRALLLPHTLGNPYDMAAVMEIVRAHDLVLVEDCCDALGARFDGRPVGTFGTLATLSFYPAHHITTGEGGAVVVNDRRLERVVRSVRDWGRDCWCPPGESNTCGRRFGWQLGELPCGYDHKYVYSTLGYNFKPTDIQAAIGTVQLSRLPEFHARRQHNFSRLHEGLRRHEQLVLPRAVPGAAPAWFAFPITVRDGTSRDRLVQWLERRNIETRQVFAGNILRQPAYRDIERRVPAPLTNSDRVMHDTFFIGVYPGLTDVMIDFVLEQFDEFFAGRDG